MNTDFLGADIFGKDSLGSALSVSLKKTNKQTIYHTKHRHGYNNNHGEVIHM